MPKAKANPTFSEQIAAFRAKRGFSLSQAAEDSGVDKTTFYRAEQGHMPTLTTAARLTRWAKISPAAVMKQFDPETAGA